MNVARTARSVADRFKLVGWIGHNDFVIINNVGREAISNAAPMHSLAAMPLDSSSNFNWELSVSTVWEARRMRWMCGRWGAL